MKQHCFFVLAAICCLAACSAHEQSRIVSRTETELKHQFTTTPEVLLNDSYGGLEEGGDVALLKLSGVDCSVLQRAFAETWQISQGSREYDTFKQIGLAPDTARFQHWKDMKGADTTYLLDTASCVLYRQAHFE